MPVDASEALLCWYAVDKRALPWRAVAGERPDPYRVWLSEVMLQQTRIAHARPYFERFVARWPDVASLAAAADGEVMAAWAGLGYYARARNLLACARIINADFGGRFPSDEAQLRRLPGIGEYTAAAIAAIAFDRRAVAVDANVERIVARLFAVRTPLPQARPTLRALADRLVPQSQAGDFAQAMMEFGQRICTARRPDCLSCPLQEYCAARREGDPALYPIRAPKRPRPRREGIAYWLEHDDQVLLLRRPDSGLLGGMLALPTDQDGAPDGSEWFEAGAVDHIFTHFALTMRLLCAKANSPAVAGICRPPAQGIWWPIERIDEAGLPTLFAKLAARGVDWRQAA